VEGADKFESAGEISSAKIGINASILIQDSLATPNILKDLDDQVKGIRLKADKSSDWWGQPGSSR